MQSISGLEGILEVLLFQLKMSQEKGLSVFQLGPDLVAVPGQSYHNSHQLLYLQGEI